MPPQPNKPVSEGAEERFEEVLERLERGLKSLRMDYNRYFIGVRDRPPLDLQMTLAAIIHRQTASGTASTRRTSDNFRFNSIVSTFHVLTEMWNRNVRNREEGRSAGQPGQDRGAAAGADAGEKQAGQEIFRTRLSANDSNAEGEELRGLYASYVQAVQETGRSTASLSYQTFCERVESRMRSYAKRTGHPEVTCRLVVVDSRPILKLGS